MKADMQSDVNDLYPRFEQSNLESRAHYSAFDNIVIPEEDWEAIKLHFDVEVKRAEEQSHFVVGSLGTIQIVTSKVLPSGFMLLRQKDKVVGIIKNAGGEFFGFAEKGNQYYASS